MCPQRSYILLSRGREILFTPSNLAKTLTAFHSSTGRARKKKVERDASLIFL